MLSQFSKQFLNQAKYLQWNYPNCVMPEAATKEGSIQNLVSLNHTLKLLSYHLIRRIEVSTLCAAGLV